MEHNFTKAKQFFSKAKTTLWLYKNLWKECTTALIRTPRDVDKTAGALSIAAEIASSGREVLYINAEQRVDRHADVAANADNLYIFTPEYESPDDPTDYADLVFDAIDQAVRTTDIRIFVVDSVSRMAALSFGRNASQAYIMKRLVAMQLKYKISILVLADDSTKTVNNALSALAATELSELSTQIVGSRPVANAEEQESLESSECSENSEPSVNNRALCIEHRALKNLSRRERRALQRRTTPRYDRFAGPHMKR